MVYDELKMLQKLKHPHIVSFVDWFESKVCVPFENGFSKKSDHVLG